jgi:hypothetical protein
MIDEEPIKRFDTPTLDDLRPLLGGDVTVAVLEKVRAVLAGEIKPSDASEACAKWVRQCYNPPSWHERVLEACNDLLGGNGVGGLDIEGADTYTDNGVRMCPPFSYVNQGDPYIVTLARDHENSAWVIADWASMAEEYEREHKLGDHEEFDEEPDCCPDCHGDAFTLEKGTSSYYWICNACNHHCKAAEGWEPSKPDDDEEDHEGTEPPSVP